MTNTLHNNCTKNPLLNTVIHFTGGNVLMRTNLYNRECQWQQH